MTSSPQPDSRISALAFFLADHAAVESGKTYVNGGFWNRMAVPGFPAPAFFSVVAVLRVPWSAYDAIHSFAVTVEDEDRNELPARFEGQFQVVVAPHMREGEPTIMPIAALVNGMTFDGPGDFSFVLRVDDTEIERWPLRVVLADEAAEAGVPALGPDEPADLPPAAT